ncbi:MAG: diguanylate cyclase [Gammaproteobacteria bacterium]
MFETIVRIFGSDLPSLPRASLTRQEQLWLLSARHHNPLLRARRAGMVAARARLLAGLFLALTPAWMLVEYLTLPHSLWVAVGTARLVVIVPFLAMLWALRAGARHRGVVALALFALFAVPAIFYVWTMQILGAGSGAGMAEAVVATHTFFPLLVVAGMGLFPLTVTESLALSLPVFVARGWVVWAVLAPGELYAVLGALWFLLLVAAAGALAAGSQLALLIALLRQSIRDPLTGAFSRASGEELLALEMTIAQRDDKPFAVAFIDLDRFKDVNDRHGHDAGDRVLAAAAASVAGSLRTTDALLRWGGGGVHGAHAEHRLHAGHGRTGAVARAGFRHASGRAAADGQHRRGGTPRRRAGGRRETGRAGRPAHVRGQTRRPRPPDRLPAG